MSSNSSSSPNPALNPLTTHLLELADALDREERRIKHRLLEMAQEGDAAGVAKVVDRWMRVPIAEVLEGVGECLGLSNSQSEESSSPHNR